MRGEWGSVGVCWGLKGVPLGRGQRQFSGCRGGQQIDGAVVAHHSWLEVEVARLDEAIFPKVLYSKVVPPFSCEHCLALQSRCERWIA